jgi:DNA-binding NtrC family response regulator
MPQTRHPILVVDDEPEILFSLQALLRRDFEVHTAEGGAQALEVLKRHPVHVIMTDQRMPAMTGVELLTRARSEHPDAIRIIFTGYADLKSVIDAVNRGEIYRYLTKPWDPDKLCAILHEACAHYQAMAERHDLLVELRDYLAQGSSAGGDETGKSLLARLERILGNPAGVDAPAADDCSSGNPPGSKTSGR